MLLLPLIAFALLWLLIADHRAVMGFGKLSLRGAMVLAFLAFELLDLAVTELTSVGHNYTAGWVAGSWGLTVVVLLTAGRRSLVRAAVRLRRHGGRSWLRIRIGNLSAEDRVWVGVVIALFATLAVVGSLYLPSNSDSLVYHLARVSHWVENRTVAPFATHYLAQVEFPPLAEFNFGFLHLLSGTDRFDADVALFSAAINVVGVSELTRLLGGSRSVQVTAAVLCATLPSGVLLATSTDNDSFAAALGIGLLIIAMSFSADGRWLWRTAALGATAGMAYLTKTTVPTMLGPAVLLLLAVALFRLHRTKNWWGTLRRASAVGAVAVVCALVVMVPFSVQNIEVFHSPVGPSTTAAESSPLTFDAGAANVLRATANNFHIGNGQSGLDTYVSKIALGALGHAYNLFHISQGDYRYSVTPTFQAFTVQLQSSNVRDEDLGANPWEVLLIVPALAVLAVAIRRGARNLRIALLLGLGLAVGYVLFSFIAKWGIYDSRYGLPLLVAWCSVIALALSRFPRWVGRLVLVALVVACLPQLLDSSTRPLVPPASAGPSYLAPYFVSCCNLDVNAEASAYQTVTASLAQSTCQHAAITDWVLYEYPLWVGLQHDHWSGLLADFDVNNPTSSLQPSYRPCARISQQGPKYSTPDNGTVNMQLGNLALSVDADHASTIQTEPPGFESRLDGVSIFPGGGWHLTGLGQLPILVNGGSLYLFAKTSEEVRLHLQAPAHIPVPSVAMSLPDGTVIPTVAGSGSIEASLHLHVGTNRVNLTVTGVGVKGRSILILQSATVGHL
jgi:hypothetical protein